MRLVRSLSLRSWVLTSAFALCFAVSGTVTWAGNSTQTSSALEERKLPMKFSWIACQPNCRGWVSAVGIITADSPKEFDEFARSRQLAGATIVLDSSGGSVNDAIALGRRFRGLGALTTVGTSVVNQAAQGARASVLPDAYCESMCVFLLLSGKTRYVPPAAHIRVHQIWMGDRADDAKAASYTAQDLMIVERDIGRLAKYTFDMGGAGELLSLALSVPPWEDLHELSAAELRVTNLVTTDAVADVLPHQDNAIPVAEAKPKNGDRFVSSAMEGEALPQAAKATKTAEAVVPTGGTAAPAPIQPSQ
ncbi:COG3904 family protein [Bradyrhizobium embrapense]